MLRLSHDVHGAVVDGACHLDGDEVSGGNWLVVRSSTDDSMRWSNTETECAEYLWCEIDYLSGRLVSLMSLCPFRVRLHPSVPMPRQEVNSPRRW